MCRGSVATLPLIFLAVLWRYGVTGSPYFWRFPYQAPRHTSRHACWNSLPRNVLDSSWMFVSLNYLAVTVLALLRRRCCGGVRLQSQRSTGSAETSLTTRWTDDVIRLKSKTPFACCGSVHGEGIPESTEAKIRIILLILAVWRHVFRISLPEAWCVVECFTCQLRCLKCRVN
jgi:hypothetical protein